MTVTTDCRKFSLQDQDVSTNQSRMSREENGENEPESVLWEYYLRNMNSFESVWTYSEMTVVLIVCWECMRFWKRTWKTTWSRLLAAIDVEIIGSTKERIESVMRSGGRKNGNLVCESRSFHKTLGMTSLSIPILAIVMRIGIFAINWHTALHVTHSSEGMKFVFSRVFIKLMGYVREWSPTLELDSSCGNSPLLFAYCFCFISGTNSWVISLFCIL